MADSDTRKLFKSLWAKVGDVTIQFWICPDESHRGGYPEPPRVTVEWDADGIAHCTTPGCTNTSAKEPNV